MAGDEAKLKTPRTRSPAYPYLALPEALERAGQIRRAEGRHAVSVSVAMQHWGYKAESSTGYSCIAALKKFGLVDEEGVGENREVRLSALALALLLDTGEGSPERAAALRTAALNPRIHAELWERYGPALPSDQTLRRFLLLEKSFNEASVDEFIAEYRATIAYAGLAEAGESAVAPGVAPPTAGVPPPPPAAAPRPARPNPAPRREVGDATLVTTLPGLESPALAPPAPPRAELPGQGRALEGRGERGGSMVGPGALVPTADAVATTPRGTGAVEGTRELPVPLDDDLVARVPYPMSEESFTLLIDTLQLWKKRLVRPSP